MIGSEYSTITKESLEDLDSLIKIRDELVVLAYEARAVQMGWITVSYGKMRPGLYDIYAYRRDCMQKDIDALDARINEMMQGVQL